MVDLTKFRKELTAHSEAFEREVKTVYSTLVLPHWESELHGFPQTLYGYMMALFARIDLLSACWKGNAASKGQTECMIEFMTKYMSHDHEANSVAVQMWRHKLMHTGEPRYLLDERTGKSYRWLLHWWEHLPYEQHYTLVETSDSKILNFGLVYLIQDLNAGVDKYLADLAESPLLQNNVEKVQEELATYKYRVH
jgi:hypothetical protein